VLWEAVSTRDRTPTIRATVRDSQTNLGKGNIAVYVDGRRRSTFSYDRARDRLSYGGGRMAYGRHTVRVVARDDVGLRTSRSWNLRVVR
jgi:hypothetical protein